MGPINLEMIGEQVALHTEFIQDMLTLHDYTFAKMYDADNDITTTPPDMMRRINDLIAGAYCHSIAINSKTGDDCIDSQGETLELKLAYIDSSHYMLNSANTVIRRPDSNCSPELYKRRLSNANNLFNAVQAKFRVYKNTSSDHHEKDTAFVLMSAFHNRFITAFMMPGREVQNILTGGKKTDIQRNISLNQFIQYGYEFGSSVPHIGWERFYSALVNFLAAKEGKLSTKETKEAFETWVGFCDEKNLQRL